MEDQKHRTPLDFAHRSDVKMTLEAYGGIKKCEKGIF